MSGYISTIATGKLKSQPHHWIEFNRYRLRMALIMLFADLLGFGAAGAILLVVNLHFDFFVFQWHDLRYLVIVFLCLALYSSTKLYPGLGLNPAVEIRLVFINTAIGFLLGIFIFTLIQMSWQPNYLALMPFGFFSVICILAARWAGRILSVKYGVWGAPAVVIGTAETANKLAHYFLDRARLGFIPKYVVTSVKNAAGVTVPVPTLDVNELRNCHVDHFSSQQIYTALIDLSTATDLLYSPVFPRLAQLFPRLIFISSLNSLQSASFQVHDLEGVMGIEAHGNLLSPTASFIKRFMDITLSLLLTLFTFPVWALTMLLIRLDSPGPILYTQLRVGQNRRDRHDQERIIGHVRKIKIYKFRTMVQDAEHVLQDYLNANPLARAEWDRTQKLKDDPRITRVGKWVRKFSIDELPQLINVLKGEMSIVGPRPMLIEQVSQYGNKMETYYSVCPGITGLWQVSGRNNTSFEERASFDEYYVNNWSIWLDIYILLRTVWVVLSRDGAY
jgi:Undecaprenyl-phosphate galactose phosphotransferase WbaP